MPMRHLTGVRIGLAALAACLLAACGHDSKPSASPTSGGTAGGTATAASTAPNPPAPTSTETGSGTGVPGGETEGSQPKACSVVTAADAAAAIGRKVGAAQSRTLGAFSSCSFVTTDGGDVGTVSVQVLQSAATAGIFDQIVSGQSGGKAVQTVPGVGDKAVIATGVLIFHKGSRVVTVFIYTQRNKTGLTNAEIALAKKVAARV
jgi:hypothetical protein